MFNLVVINRDSADVEIKLLHPPTPLINRESADAKIKLFSTPTPLINRENVDVEIKLHPTLTPLSNRDKAERRGLEHLCRIGKKKKKGINYNTWKMSQEHNNKNHNYDNFH